MGHENGMSIKRKIPELFEGEVRKHPPRNGIFLLVTHHRLVGLGRVSIAAILYPSRASPGLPCGSTGYVRPYRFRLP